jgi:hypothetical protein
MNDEKIYFLKYAFRDIKNNKQIIDNLADCSAIFPSKLLSLSHPESLKTFPKKETIFHT